MLLRCAKEMRWPHFAKLAAAMLSTGLIAFLAGVFAGAKRNSQTVNESAHAAIEFAMSANNSLDLSEAVFFAEQLDRPPEEALPVIRRMVAGRIELIREGVADMPEHYSQTSTEEINDAKNIVAHLRKMEAQQVEAPDAE